MLYFHHPNGSFIRVPQRAGHLATYPAGGRGPDGGIIIYYVQAPNEPTTTAFPKGFRMVTGNPMLREQTHFGASPDAWALTLRCWDVDALTTPFGPSNDHNASPGSPHDTIHLPRKVCPGGVRSQIFFPACWDGKNVDSPDHRSHVAFPMGDVGKDGVYQMPSKCPDSHPVRMPTLFYEVIWETNLFNDPELWPKDGSQPFVWSMGDPTGYGHHGDYMFGWEGDVLQRTMDTCVSAAGRPEECTVLTLQTDEEMSKCKLGPMVPEIVEGQCEWPAQNFVPDD